MIHKTSLLPKEELAIYLEGAIATSNYFEVSLAILKGADLEDMDGVHPLKFAMDCGDQRIVDLLLNAGAKLPKYLALEKIRETDQVQFLRELDLDSYERIYKMKWGRYVKE
jgi:hypothetical protein